MATAPSKKGTTVRQRLKIVQQLEEGATIQHMANEYGVSKEQYSDIDKMRCRYSSKVIILI